MRRSTKVRRQDLRFGQAILLGVRIERKDEYAKPRWYASLPLGEGERLIAICGPWPTRWQAVNHALEKLGVLQ